MNRIRDQLDHPVIDTDGHVIEFLPWVRDLVGDLAGPDAAERFDQMVGSAPIVRQVPIGRRRQAGVTRSAWWGVPARNTLDRATAMLPELLYRRLDEIGIDLALLYPTYGLTVTGPSRRRAQAGDGPRLQHLHGGGLRRTQRPVGTRRIDPDVHSRGGHRRARPRRR